MRGSLGNRTVTELLDEPRPNRRTGYDVEDAFRWDEWIPHIPELSFPSEWKVKVIPPFAGAMARFQVTYQGSFASIYLDVYEILGCFGEPYWEVYPVNGDVGRVAMADTTGLIEMITASLAETDKELEDES